MPKLLQINSVINAGSTGRIAEEIGRIALANGWESYIAFGRNDRPSQSQKVKIGNKLNVYWHLLMTRLFDRHGLHSRAATKRLIIEIEKINPDIIHLHNLHGYYINIEILFRYLQKKDVSVVATLHDCWMFTGHCAYFESVGCDRWKTDCYSCPKKREYPSSILLDNSRRNYKIKKEVFTSIKNLKLIPVSQWLGNLLGDSFLNKIDHEVIHNGVDTNLFKIDASLGFKMRKRYGLENKFIILGVASVWDQRKGLDDFIQLSENIDNETTAIILIGLSQKQLQKLPSNIIGISRTENIEALVAYYNAANLFVNPTWEDNFPTTNIEALACGTPIVTYRTGGSVEAVSEKSGYIVDQGDIQGLVSVIEEVRANGKDVYLKYCRSHVVENYDMHKQFAKYFDVYEQLQKNNE